ncbi:ATP-binding protein [Gracilimonas mengyeensis]|uniref:Serine/threonine-protein kinase RsbW n=1 Tax=Gracilimonas mengyeensis TaxID=1302730 RepID=A0A521ACN9_9BACT|nr:ATP-binding protein [Gracilimonas mengyeensis]SMO32594.1 serine/threonine-protein kinase RsbW [Gracilimonas mengyeensis]
MKLLETLRLSSSYEEVEKVEGLLSALQDKLGFDDAFYARLMLTVSEAATNGIVHGNKLDASKSVEIAAFTNDGALVVETQDEGEGFNPEDIPDPRADENLYKPSGRGVFLMEEYADEVKYSDGGSKLTLIFNLPSD